MSRRKDNVFERLSIESVSLGSCIPYIYQILLSKFVFSKNLLSNVYRMYYQFINNITIETMHQPPVGPLKVAIIIIKCCVNRKGKHYL